MLKASNTLRERSSSGSNGNSDRQSNSSSEDSIFHRRTPILTPPSQNRIPCQNFNQFRDRGSFQSPPGLSPGRGRGRQVFRGQFSANRPKISRDGAKYWAYDQERKIKIVDLLGNCWPKEIYQALEEFGTMVRIDMNDQRTVAWVTFQ